MDYSKLSLELCEECQGKLEVVFRIKVNHGFENCGKSMGRGDLQ